MFRAVSRLSVRVARTLPNLQALVAHSARGRENVQHTVSYTQDALLFSLELASPAKRLLRVQLLGALEVSYRHASRALELVYASDRFTEDGCELRALQTALRALEVRTLTLSYVVEIQDVAFVEALVEQQRIESLRIGFRQRTVATMRSFLAYLTAQRGAVCEVLVEISFSDCLSINLRTQAVQLKLLDDRDVNAETAKLYRALSRGRTHFRSLQLTTVEPFEFVARELLAAQSFQEVFLELAGEFTEMQDAAVAQFLAEQRLLGIFILNARVRHPLLTLRALARYSRSNCQDVKITNAALFAPESLQLAFDAAEQLRKYDLSFYDNQVQIQKNGTYELIVALTDAAQLAEIAALVFDVLRCLRATSLPVALSCDLQVFYAVSARFAQHADAPLVRVAQLNLILDVAAYRESPFAVLRFDEFRVHSARVQLYTSVYKQAVLVVEDGERVCVDLRKIPLFRNDRLLADFVLATVPRRTRDLYAFVPQSDGFGDTLPIFHEFAGNSLRQKTSLREFQRSLVGAVPYLQTLRANRPRRQTLHDAHLEALREATLAALAFKRRFQQHRNFLRREIFWEIYSEVLLDAEKHATHSVVPAAECEQRLRSLFN